MTEFFCEWFGVHAGREVFYAERKTRKFMEKPEGLSLYVQERGKSKFPAYCSVQPYTARDQPFGLEKLFFDFDCEKDTSKAWKDVSWFAENLIQYYNILPFITFSGNKGYHVYVFLKNTVQFPTWRLTFVKKVYETLQKKILKGLEFETLDPAVLGDIKRLARVPFSIHEKTGKMCSPLSLNHHFIEIRMLDIYREFGLDTSLLEPVCKELKAEEKWRELLATKAQLGFEPSTQREVRPCIKNALALPLKRGEGHKMRIAIAAENLNKGASVDQVVELFRSQPDFGDGSKARYYVEDIARKAYKPFKCKTIRELGFCLKEACPIYGRRKRVD